MKDKVKKILIVAATIGIWEIISNIITKLAEMAGANLACLWIIYQPKIPKNLKKVQ